MLPTNGSKALRLALTNRFFLPFSSSVKEGAIVLSSCFSGQSQTYTRAHTPLYAIIHGKQTTQLKLLIKFGVSSGVEEVCFLGVSSWG
jgi:hypothetical protein